MLTKDQELHVSLSDSVFAFLRRDWFIETSYKFSFVFQFLSIFLQIALFYFFARFIGDGAAKFLQPYGGDYFSFVLIGLAYQNYFIIALHSFSRNLRRDQMLGTLEMMLLAPVSGQRILALSSSFEIVFNSLKIILYLIIGAAFFSLSLHQLNLLTCIVILLLTIISFSGLGMLSAALILYMKRGDPVVWIFSVANSLFGGVYFTQDVLPPSMKFIAYLLPMTHSLEAFRLAVLQNTGLVEVFPQIIYLCLFSAVSLPIGFFAFRKALLLAKLHGTLGQY